MSQRPKQCLSCGKKAVIDLPYGPHRYCRQHFLHFFEKRARKNLRLRHKIGKTESLLLALDGSAAAQALLALLPGILSPKNRLQGFFLEKAKKVGEARKLAQEQGLEILPGRFKPDDLKKLGKQGRIVWPASLEDEAVEKLQGFMQKSKRQLELVKPLGSSPEKEIEFYCRLKKIAFKKTAAKKRLRRWLDKLEKQFPGSGFSLMKSLRQLENLK